VSEKTTDFTVEDLGTMWQITAHTQAAQEWVDENVGEIDPILGTSDSFLGDWRPMRDIARGMVDAGLAGAGLPWHVDPHAKWPTGG